MNILDETAAALPEVSDRLRDFLAPRMGRPAGEAASAPVPAAPEAEAESGSEDEGPEAVPAAPEPPADDSTPDEAGDAPHEPAPTAEADASALAEHPLDGAH